MAGKGTHKDGNNKSDRIVDFTEARARKMEEKRLTTERVFFKNLLGVYSVVDGAQMKGIELLDVSEDGCSFQVPFNPDKPWPADTKEIPIRMYFSQDTYLPVKLKIQNSAPTIIDGVRYVRYGCKVEKTGKNYDTFKKFVQFLKSFSETAYKDEGDVQVFYL